MKIGLDSFSYRHNIAENSLDWFLRRLVDLGLDGCQVDPAHLSGWDSGVVGRVAGFCGSHGLYLELGSGGFDHTRLSARLELAQSVGARAVRTFISWAGETPERLAELSELAIGELSRLAETAERLRIPLAIENHEDYTSAELLRIVQSVGSPFVGVCLDTGNALAVGEDPLDCARALAPYAASCHLKDCRRADGPGVETGYALGEGDVPITGVLEIIRAAQPTLPITMEVPSAGIEDEERVVRKSLAWLRSARHT